MHYVGSPGRARPPAWPPRINLRLAASRRACQPGKQRQRFQPGESAGLALVMLTEGGGTSEAPGPHGTSLPSPPDRLGASGLCQRLWPLQTPIYMTAEESGLDQGERERRGGKI